MTLTRAQLLAAIDAACPDNASGGITPAIMRGILAQMQECAPNIEDNDPLVAYSPAVPGNWAGTAPVTLAEAIDRLAAANPGA
jgi:hypothetical protein